VFVLVVCAEVVTGFGGYMAEHQWILNQLIGHRALAVVLINLFFSAYYSIINNLGCLLLILIGARAARRHGSLALLLPLGYLIPIVLLGRFDYDPKAPYLLVGASAAVLIYRVVVTLIAPLWIVRSASDRAKIRAATIGLLTAVGIIAAANIFYSVVINISLDGAMNWRNVFYSISPELIPLVGICLAVSLYQPVPSEQPALQPTPVVMET
jgi:hypothetical protein